MNYSNYRFTLDIQSIQSQVSLPVKFGDTARSLYITITDGGVPYVLRDGCWAVFSAIKGDENHLLNNCVIENNAIIRYDFTEQTATAEGIMQCEIILYGSEGGVIGSPRFVMVVDKRIVYDKDILSTDERDTIDSIITTENDRKAAEEARKKAEEERAQAVQEVIDYMNDAKNDFIIFSNQVSGSENERRGAENNRVTAENNRALAENVRERNETTRQSNETQRQNNEETRESNETKRKKTFADMESLCNAMEARVSNLENAATGKIYNAVVSEGIAHTIQLPKTLRYGIVNKVGGMSYYDEKSKEYTHTQVTKISIGLPYSLEGALLYDHNQTGKVGGKVVLTENGAIAPKGTKYGIFFPCELPKGTVLSVGAEGSNSSGGAVAKFGMYSIKDNNATLDASGLVFLNKEITLSADATHLLIVKEDTKTALTEDMEIKNLQVVLKDPNQGSIMTEIDALQIPGEAQDLTYYGMGIDESCYNYLDFETKLYVGNCGIRESEERDELVAFDETRYEDLSEFIPSDVITLAPYCLVRFENENGLPVPYSISYKQKI